MYYLYKTVFVSNRFVIYTFSFLIFSEPLKTMRGSFSLLFLILCLTAAVWSKKKYDADLENEFAEFEDVELEDEGKINCYL